MASEHSKRACPRSLVRTASLMAVTAGCSAVVHADVSTRAVALSGRAAPGAGGGVTYTQFQPPVIDGRGRVSFHAQVSGAGVTTSNDQGLWSESGGLGLALIAREGSAAPGAGPGLVFDTQTFQVTPSVNCNGRIAFLGRLAGSGVTLLNNTGIWSDAGGAGLALIVRTGDAAPGVSGDGDFVALGPPRLGRGGDTAFKAYLFGGDVTAADDVGLWRVNAAGSGTLVARAGQHAVETPGGVMYDEFSEPVVNALGRTAFLAQLAHGGIIGAANDTGVWRQTASAGLDQVAWEGDTAAGLPMGVVLSQIFAPVINHNGDVAFRAMLSVGGASGIWKRGSAYELVAKTDDAAPSTEPGTVFGSFLDPVIGGSGNVCFVALLSGPDIGSDNNSGIWMQDGEGGLTLLAREGGQAPGVESSVVFSAFSALVSNTPGQVAFTAILTGPGVTTSNDRGVWATNGQGELILVLREGDQIDADPAEGVVDLRTVTSVDLVLNSGGQDGRPSSFGARGELALHVGYTSGSGVVVAVVGGPTSGDFNSDGVFDLADLIAFNSVWQPQIGLSVPAGTGGDFNGDEFVDLADLIAFNTEWQPRIGTQAPC